MIVLHIAIERVIENSPDLQNELKVHGELRNTRKRKINIILINHIAVFLHKVHFAPHSCVQKLDLYNVALYCSPIAEFILPTYYATKETPRAIQRAIDR